MKDPAETPGLSFSQGLVRKFPGVSPYTGTFRSCCKSRGNSDCTGAKQATYDGKELNVLVGLDSKGRNVNANITGSRNEAETSANLLVSRFTTLTAKK
jgi:hypothetical protein